MCGGGVVADPTVWAWLHPYSLWYVHPLLIGWTFFAMGTVIWRHAWRGK